MDENKDRAANATEEKFDIKISGKPSAMFMAAVKLIAVGIVIYVCLSRIEYIRDAVAYVYKILNPLIMGAIVALILNTPMVGMERLLTKIFRRFSKKQHKRLISGLAILLTFVFLFLIVYIIGDTVIPQIVESFKSIFQKIRENIPKYLELLNGLEEYGFNTDPVAEWLTTIDINELINKLSENAQSIINTVISSASSIVSGTFNVITSIVFTVYILSNKKKLANQMKKIMYAYLKKSYVDRTIRIGSLVTKTFSNFFSGQCIEVVILGTMMFIAMTVLRFPYALTISAILTLTALIPYIGAFVGGAFGCLLILIDDPFKALLFVVLFLVVQQIENHLIYPKVVGGSVGLPAIWTFAAVIIGGGVWGVLGMLLFIPVFSVLYTLLRENVYSRLDRRGIEVAYDSESADDIGSGGGLTKRIADAAVNTCKKTAEKLRNMRNKK